MRFKYILLLLLLSSTLLFAKSVATITSLKGDVFIQRGSSMMAAKLGIKLSQRDRIITRGRSKAQIIFNDDTVISIGKNTDFSIKEYLYDEKKPTAQFSILRGAMRTITGQIGKIAPKRFNVRTANAVIGIRGTNFSIYAKKDGSQDIYCTFGKIGVTVNGVQSIVDQGFLAQVSDIGAIKVKAFNYKDLLKLQKENFGDSKSASTSKQEDKKSLRNLANSGQIDTTKVELVGPVSENIAKQNRDNIQLIAANEIDITSGSDDTLTPSEPDISKPEPSEPNVVEPEPGEPDEPGTPLPPPPSIPSDPVVTILYDEDGRHVTALDSINNDSSVDFEIYNDSQGDLKVSANLNINNSQINADLSVDSTPAYYNSKDDFAVAFTNVMIGSASATNILFDSELNEFTSKSDISADDDMSWGEWAVAVTFNDTNGDNISINDNGLWVSGKPTNSNLIGSYSLSYAAYSGEYRAYVNGVSGIVSGDATMAVNFAQDTANLNINNLPNHGSITYNMLIEDNNVVSYISNSTNSQSSANGTFYGDSGNSIGGTFTEHSSGVKVVDGVYQVSTTTELH